MEELQLSWHLFSGGSNYSDEFASGINAIEQLGKCMIAASYPEAALIQVDGQPVLLCLHDCTRIGMKTFAETQKKMTAISIEAGKLMEQSGPIARIVKYLGEPSSRIAARNITREKGYLDSSYKKLKTQLSSIQIDWSEWQKSTSKLSIETLGSEVQAGGRQSNTDYNLRAQERLIKDSEFNVGEITVALKTMETEYTRIDEELRRKLAESKSRVEKDKWYHIFRAESKRLKKELAAKHGELVRAQGELWKNQERLARSRMDSFQLKMALETLKTEKERLARIRECLAAAGSALACMIGAVQGFISMFDTLSVCIELLQRDLDRLRDAIDDGQRPPEEYTSYLYEETIEDANRLRISFGFARYIAALYAEVSRSHYIPGVQLAFTLGATSLGSSTFEVKEVVTEKKSELADFKAIGLREVKQLCDRRHSEINSTLERMGRAIAGPRPRLAITAGPERGNQLRGADMPSYSSFSANNQSQIPTPAPGYQENINTSDGRFSSYASFNGNQPVGLRGGGVDVSNGSLYEVGNGGPASIGTPQASRGWRRWLGRN